MSEKELKKELLKYRDTLSITGLGVLAFGLWSIIRMFLSLALYDDYLGLSTIETAGKIFFYIVIAFLVIMDIILRLKVGLDAYKEGKRIKKGMFYIVIAALIFLPSSILSIISGAEALRTDVIDSAVSLIVEATSLITTIEMIVSAVMVKKLSKELGEN